MNRCLDFFKGLINHFSHRRVFVADDVSTGDDGTEPVEEMQEVSTGNAGKEILGSAGKSDHLMRKYRSQDKHQVIVKDRFIDVDGNRFT